MLRFDGPDGAKDFPFLRGASPRRTDHGSGDRHAGEGLPVRAVPELGGLLGDPHQAVPLRRRSTVPAPVRISFLSGAPSTPVRDGAGPAWSTSARARSSSQPSARASATSQPLFTPAGGVITVAVTPIVINTGHTVSAYPLLPAAPIIWMIGTHQFPFPVRTLVWPDADAPGEGYADAVCLVLLVIGVNPPC